MENGIFTDYFILSDSVLGICLSDSTFALTVNNIIAHIYNIPICMPGTSKHFKPFGLKVLFCLVLFGGYTWWY